MRFKNPKNCNRCKKKLEKSWLFCVYCGLRKVSIYARILELYPMYENCHKVGIGHTENSRKLVELTNLLKSENYYNGLGKPIGTYAVRKLIYEIVDYIAWCEKKNLKVDVADEEIKNRLMKMHKSLIQNYKNREKRLRIKREEVKETLLPLLNQKIVYEGRIMELSKLTNKLANFLIPVSANNSWPVVVEEDLVNLKITQEPGKTYIERKKIVKEE